MNLYGLLLYLCEMFFETQANIDFAGYADDKTLYTYSWNIESVLDSGQGALEKIFHWVSLNDLVANAGKCHFLTSFNAPVDMHISNTEILNR